MTTEDPDTPTALAEPRDLAPPSEDTVPPAESVAADSSEVTIPTPENVSSEAPAEPPPPESKRRWYVIKVASNREESTKRNIERQMKIEGLEEFFGAIEIPVEIVVEVKKVTDTTKAGDKTTKTKKVEKKVKKFPGYIMLELEWTPEVQAMLRGVSGVTGFVGDRGIGKAPQPMPPEDVQRMLGTQAGGPATPEGAKKPKTEVVKLNFEKGDKVRIREGAFASFEGEVKGITEPKEAGETPIVTVEVQVLGRPTSIELEFWQVDKL